MQSSVCIAYERSLLFLYMPCEMPSGFGHGAEFIPSNTYSNSSPRFDSGSGHGKTTPKFGSVIIVEFESKVPDRERDFGVVAGLYASNTVSSSPLCRLLLFALPFVVLLLANTIRTSAGSGVLK